MNNSKPLPTGNTERADHLRMLYLCTAGIVAFVVVATLLVCLVFSVSVNIEPRTFADHRQATLPASWSNY